MLGAPEARVGCSLSGAAVHRLADGHCRGAANHGYAQWTLLTLETFCAVKDVSAPGSHVWTGARSGGGQERRVGRKMKLRQCSCG